MLKLIFEIKKAMSELKNKTTLGLFSLYTLKEEIKI